jgi:hypothetical protein
MQNSWEYIRNLRVFQTVYTFQSCNSACGSYTVIRLLWDTNIFFFQLKILMTHKVSRDSRHVTRSPGHPLYTVIKAIFNVQTEKFFLLVKHRVTEYTSQRSHYCAPNKAQFSASYWCITPYVKAQNNYTTPYLRTTINCFADAGTSPEPSYISRLKGNASVKVRIWIEKIYVERSETASVV